MLAQLQACHLAPNTYLIGLSSFRTRNCGHQQRQQATSSVCSRSSTTAAAASSPRRGWSADHSNGLGALLRKQQLPQAVALLETCLDSSQRVHGVDAGQLLEALCAAGQHSTAWSLLQRITASKGRLPLQVLHRLLKLSGQFGTVGDVLAVYEHQQQMYGFASAGVQTTLIHALLKAHSKSQPGHLLAYEAWGRLKKSGKQLDAQALLAGIHACVCVGQFRAAQELLEPLRAAAGPVGWPMVSAYNVIIKGHIAAGNLDAARKAFVAMTSRGLSPDAVTYNTLISGSAKRGDMAAARSLVHAMQLEGVLPDVWTYTTLALGYGEQGQLQEVRQVVQQMQEAGVKANSAMFAVVIDALASAGQLQEAQSVLQQLQDNQPGVFGREGRSICGSDIPQSALSPSRQQAWTNPSAAASVQSSATAHSDSDSTLSSVSIPSASDPAESDGSATGSAAAAGLGSAPQSPDSALAGHTDGLKSTRSAQQQAQSAQRQDLAGGTRNRQQVLRHQYNSLIKGCLQLAAAQASEQAEQLWLLSEGSSGSSSPISSSSSGKTTPVAMRSFDGNSAQAAAEAAAADRAVPASSANGTSPVPSQQPARVVAVTARQPSSSQAGQAGQQSPAQHLVAPSPASLQQLPQAPLQPQQQQQRLLQPAARRPQVALVRPTLPPQQPAATAFEPQAAAAAATAVASRRPVLPAETAQAQRQPLLQQQAPQPLQINLVAEPLSSNGNSVQAAVQAAASQTVGVAAAAGDGAAAGPSDPFSAAVDVMQQMQAAGVSPAADTYTLFVDYCIEVGDATKLQQMLDAATRAGVQPDQVMLTSCIKAAWQDGAHEAAVDVFNALLSMTGTPRRRGRSRSSSSSSSAASSSSAQVSTSTSTAAGSTSRVPSSSTAVDGNGNGSGKASSAAGSSGSAGVAQSSSSSLKRPQQQRVSLAQSLRAYAQAAAADSLRPPSAAGSREAAAVTPLSDDPQQQQQGVHQELEWQLQQQIASTRQQQQPAASAEQPPSDLSQPQDQQQQPSLPPSQQQQQQHPAPRRPSGQLLLPLSAPIGPDSAAWNALVAALVRSGQLEDAAVALERSTQASAAGGASEPSVAGYSALMRGYRRAGLKHKAVGLLRQFLNLGGRPGRVMCDDAISLCLEARDVKTARQVVRAMELTGCLDAEGISFYDGWFRRWELQQQQALLPRHLQQSLVSRGARGDGSSAGGSDAAAAAAAAGQPGSGDGSRPVAVERLKWWLGLPNSYYKGEGREGLKGGQPPQQ